MKLIVRAVMLGLLLTAAFASSAQEGDPSPAPPMGQQITPLPSSYALAGITFEYQGWNNCGPATLTNALTYFGYADKQSRAASWLKPNREDKNVSPWQMVQFVNSQVPEIPVYALERVGGTLDMLKLLISNNYPVIIEAGYDPEPDRLGWMGHYLLVSGYDDASAEFITQDSYLGPNLRYSYDHIQRFWQHFNYTYIVLYDSGAEPALLDLLGANADPQTNALNALQIATAEATADRSNAFAWFNMGTNFVRLGIMDRAVIAYDEARRIGLPWRMLWYQFGPFEAYYAEGRYQDMIDLARNNLNDGGGQYVEETFYYAGLAREALGERDRAINNLREAVNFNPNFTAAREKLDQLTQ